MHTTTHQCPSHTQQITTRALGIRNAAYLLPLIDMANHRAHSKHRVEVQEGAFVLRLGEDVQEGKRYRVYAFPCGW